jgi:peptidoglycan hydrolase-like protein with peptidoglycan-binding domain
MNLIVGVHAASWLVYQRGSSGENVRSIQYMLRQHGYNISADGDFGPATESAVKSFQSAHQLSVDGVVGANTWTALIVTTQSGSHGDAVTALQRQLNAHGSNLTVDGNFGPATNSAVRSFQSAHHLSVDGVAGPNTWNALIGGSGGSGGGGGGGGSGKLTQSQAASMLRSAGIAVSSSGNCSDRNNPHCTSLDGIRATTINGIIAFKRSSGCAITITGGTETGHAAGTFSHANGYKVDVSHTACVTNYIHSHFTNEGLRGDGAPLYDDAHGNPYADEGSHWDITYLN